MPGITLVPVLHGRAVFSSHVRDLCNREPYDCIAIDLPETFSTDLPEAVAQLPFISAVTARLSIEAESPVYYIPTDPCDATIEGMRQAQQNHIPCRLVGYPELFEPAPLPPLPDAYAVGKMGFDAFTALCIEVLGKSEPDTRDDLSAQYIACKLLELKTHHKNILALVHFRHVLPVMRHIKEERTHNLSFPDTPEYNTQSYHINQDHLYFVLGELPFVTGTIEKERHDLFATRVDITETVKDLFRHTRDHYFDNQEETLHLSPVRIQNGLTFLRNLTVMDNCLIPSLFDIVATAKGIGGNAYALNILKSAKYYPYIPIEQDRQVISVGIDKVRLPDRTTPDTAINLFRDTALQWRTLSIKPDPSELRKKKYRYAWNPMGMCSHIPEDSRIENFNTHIRTKAKQILCEDMVKSEKFESSVKDGIDIRETLRNWHTGNIYVREIPPSRGSVDTVIIIFDDAHDEKYPQHTTWYAEHTEESTLTFYSTDPFEDMIGPGVARCTYGGLSLLFPPRSIPCAFELTKDSHIKKLSHRLTYGALLFTLERSVAYISVKKPDLYLRKLASKMKKHLIWIPLSSFSSETLRRLRRFHILNGKNVRSWASRFIGE